MCVLLFICSSLTMLCSLIIPKPAWERVFARLNRNLVTTCLVPTNNHSLTPNIFRHLLCAPLIIFEILSSLMLLLISHRHIQTKNYLKRAARVPLSCFLECPWAQGLLSSLCDTYRPLGHIQQSESSRPVPSGTPWPTRKKKAGIKMQFLFLTLWPTKILSAKKPAIP